MKKWKLLFLQAKSTTIKFSPLAAWPKYRSVRYRNHNQPFL
jgi:hypothetical protein